MLLLIITVVSVFFIEGTSAGDCKDYETCKNLAPGLNGICDEIKSKWNATFTCLTKPGACSDVAGVGVISGLCQGYLQSYEEKANCTGVVCGTSGNTPSFNDTKRMVCQSAMYPRTCNETKYKLYHNCLKNAANDLFTEAIVQGMCENFRIADGTKCSFSLGTCTLVTFTSGTRVSTSAPVTTVVGNNTVAPTLLTTLATSGAGMFIASFFVLINAAGATYWSS